MIYHSIRRVWFIFLFQISAIALVAQDSTSRHLWTLNECIEYAKSSNININTAVLSSRINLQNYLQSQAAVLPNLGGAASQSAVYANKDGTTRKVTNTGSIGLSSSVVVYNGGFLRNDIKQKNLEVESANLSVVENTNDITLQITQSFLTILLDKEAIVFATDLVNTSKAQLDQSTYRNNAGAISKKDFLTSQAQLAQDQFNLTEAINSERRDKITLKQLMLITDTAFDVAKPDTIINNQLVTPLIETQDIAQANRPEVKNAQLGVQISELDLKKAHAAYKPTLSIGAGIGTSYAPDPSFTFIKQFDNNFYQQIGLSLSVPIFTRRVAKTGVEIAKIGIEQSKLDLKNVQTTLSLDIERAFVNLQNAQGQYDAAVEQLAANRDIFQIVNEELRLGSVNMVDFILQRNQYIDALRNYLQAKYNVALSGRIYDFYRGVPITLE
jgi:outer membrane protein